MKQDPLTRSIKPRVLLAEDDPDQSEMLCETLEDEGYTVDTAFSDPLTAGALSVGGLLSAPSFAPPTGTSAIALNGGATVGSGVSFINTGGLTLGGTLRFAGNFSTATPATLVGRAVRISAAT